MMAAAVASGENVAQMWFGLYAARNTGVGPINTSIGRYWITKCRRDEGESGKPNSKDGLGHAQEMALVTRWPWSSSS
jgi:hypothetical protein